MTKMTRTASAEFASFGALAPQAAGPPRRRRAVQGPGLRQHRGWVFLSRVWRLCRQHGGPGSAHAVQRTAWGHRSSLWRRQLLHPPPTMFMLPTTRCLPQAAIWPRASSTTGGSGRASMNGVCSVCVHIKGQGHYPQTTPHLSSACLPTALLKCQHHCRRQQLLMNFPFPFCFCMERLSHGLQRRVPHHPVLAAHVLGGLRPDGVRPRRRGLRLPALAGGGGARLGCAAVRWGPCVHGGACLHECTWWPRQPRACVCRRGTGLFNNLPQTLDLRPSRAHASRSP